METQSYFKARGMIQSIATNGSSVFMSRVLEKVGIMKYMDLFLGYEDSKIPKPDPSIINMTLEKLDVERENTVFVDDSVIGLGAGKNAGVHVVGITTGIHSRKQIESVSPDYIIDRLGELRKIII